jgi:hypothetical protein
LEILGWYLLRDHLFLCTRGLTHLQESRQHQIQAFCEREVLSLGQVEGIPGVVIIEEG